MVRRQTEWDGAAYHRLSNPQHEWGRKVLARLALRGDETVLDLGCGSGRLTAELAERLPRGRVLAMDLSRDMLRQATRHLAPRFGGRVLGAHAGALGLPAAGTVDVVFSTATFHWVLDHPALYREVFAALRPGGRLLAQCGGGANLARLHARAQALMREPRFAPFFGAWREPWNFADAASTAERLRAAGFVDVVTGLEDAPTPLPDAETFSAFIAAIVLRVNLLHLPDDETRGAFIGALTDLAAADQPPFALDYVRLNLAGCKPALEQGGGSLPLAPPRTPPRSGGRSPPALAPRTKSRGEAHAARRSSTILQGRRPSAVY